MQKCSIYLHIQIMEINQIIDINIIAYLNIFNYKMVHLTKMHLSETRPKQFEDISGNLWNPEELSNFTPLKTILI